MESHTVVASTPSLAVGGWGGTGYYEFAARVLGLDALQLQRAVGIPHDLRCGAPLQRDGTNLRLGVAMSRWIVLLHRRAGQERVVMSTAS